MSILMCGVGNCPSGELSVWGIVRVGNCPVGNCPSGELSSGELSVYHSFQHQLDLFGKQSSMLQLLRNRPGTEVLGTHVLVYSSTSLKYSDSYSYS